MCAAPWPARSAPPARSRPPRACRTCGRRAPYSAIWPEQHGRPTTTWFQNSELPHPPLFGTTEDIIRRLHRMKPLGRFGVVPVDVGVMVLGQPTVDRKSVV